jgi:hypothetical protein
MPWASQTKETQMKKPRKKIGRPALDDSGSVKVSVLIPLDHWHELMAVSARSGESAAATIRRLLLEGLTAKKSA